MQDQIFEIFRALRRRIKIIISSTLLVSISCIIGAFTLPRKFESSTTILIRPDQTLNPISGLQMSEASEEQLRNFDEIIRSRALLISLVDSLGLITPMMSDAQQFEIAKLIGMNIYTLRSGSDAFRIGFVDTDPYQAQKAAQVIANLFISIKTSIENRQNEYTVQFYEKKVEEYRTLFEAKSQSLVNAMKKTVTDLPAVGTTLYEKINEIERDIALNTNRIRKNQEALTKLDFLINELGDQEENLCQPSRKEDLYVLLREDLPFISDLRALVNRFDEASIRYTQNHPEVEKLGRQIIDHLGRMRQGIVSEVKALKTQGTEFEKKRINVIEELKKYSALSKTHEEQQSNYDIGRKMYEDMKIKLEQARLAQEVGSRGANQFVIFDPAYLPVKPTKPNRLLIIGSRFGGGILLGLILTLIFELFDSTIRRPRDMEVYEKPVLALLPERKISE